MDKALLKQLQQALCNKGFNTKGVDGLMGKDTMAAMAAFQKSIGLPGSGIAGPKTIQALIGVAPSVAETRLPFLPWINGARLQIGLHEQRDNAFLRKFLTSDGKTVGDPAKIAWCGDYVQTWMKLSLPDEPVWPTNPFAAVNWATWGDYVKPQYGCVMSFHRGDPSNWQGHVAWYVSEDAAHYHVLGANQNDSINIAKIPRSRLRDKGSRWAKTGPRPTGQVIVGDGSKVIEATSVA